MIESSYEVLLHEARELLKRAPNREVVEKVIEPRLDAMDEPTLRAMVEDLRRRAAV